MIGCFDVFRLQPVTHQDKWRPEKGVAVFVRMNEFNLRFFQSLDLGQLLPLVVLIHIFHKNAGAFLV